MKKLIGVLITLLALNGCANSLAFLGPASTSITGGNVAQSAFSSAVSYGVKKQTGKLLLSTHWLMCKNIIQKTKKKNV